MHHIVRGALGVAVVYPLVWHYSSQELRVPPATTAAAPTEQYGAERSPPDRAGAEELAPAGAARAVTERAPAPPTRGPVAVVEPHAPEPIAARAPAVPPPTAPQQPSVKQQPSVQQPRDPLAELGQVQTHELEESMAQAADIQRHAANPAELEHALQGVDEDPAKLARLKALADMLVQLPTPRADSYLQSSGPAVRGGPAR